MADQLRICSRTGCRWPAAASLSYRYEARQAWLLDLPPEPDPSLYDLCPHHADHLVVPRGWARDDQRTIPPVVVEPAGRELGPGTRRRVATPSRELQPVGAGARRSGNRYAELLLELPRLAAELSASADRDPGAPAARPSTGDRPERSSEPLRAGQGAAPTGDEPPDADPQPSSDSTLA